MTAIVQFVLSQYSWTEYLFFGVLSAIAFGAITGEAAGAAIAGGAIATLHMMAGTWRGNLDGYWPTVKSWASAWTGTALGTLAWVFLI